MPGLLVRKDIPLAYQQVWKNEVSDKTISIDPRVRSDRGLEN